jgi:hypothetical protein
MNMATYATAGYLNHSAAKSHFLGGLAFFSEVFFQLRAQDKN